jgi:hypothetical protein
MAVKNAAATDSDVATSDDERTTIKVLSRPTVITNTSTRENSAAGYGCSVSLLLTIWRLIKIELHFLPCQ